MSKLSTRKKSEKVHTPELTQPSQKRLLIDSLSPSRRSTWWVISTRLNHGGFRIQIVRLTNPRCIRFSQPEHVLIAVNGFAAMASASMYSRPCTSCIHGNASPGRCICCVNECPHLLGGSCFALVRDGIGALPAFLIAFIGAGWLLFDRMP